MADRALNLDDFLSRFQLLRPQPSRHALNPVSYTHLTLPTILLV